MLGVDVSFVNTLGRMSEVPHSMAVCAMKIPVEGLHPRASSGIGRRWPSEFGRHGILPLVRVLPTPP